MKRLFLLLSALFLVILMTGVTLAQEKVDIDKASNQTLVSLAADVDSTGLTASTVTSEWFPVQNYIGNNFNTYPVSYTKLIKSAAGHPHVTTTIEGSNDQENVAIVDSVGGVSDSVETLQSGTLNLNNKKYWYYRIKHKGEAGNRADVTSKVDLLFTKP
jgi:hypothetical protein